MDISFSGIKFREERPELPLKVDHEDSALRFYFTPSSYLRLVVEVKRVTPFREDDREGLEYGCELDNGTRSLTTSSASSSVSCTNTSRGNRLPGSEPTDDLVLGS